MKRKTWLFLTILILTGAVAGWGQNGIWEFLTPVFLSRGAGIASIDSPQSDVLNPAAAGGKQNTTLDVSYIHLSDFAASDSAGHILNAGISIPTRAGVISGGGGYFSSPFNAVYGDAFGRLNLSFAKDLYRNLFVGAGVGFQLGSDWGLGLDLGFLHFPGDLGFLKDFRWGAAVRGLGKGYARGDESLTSPANFTPDIGATFKVLKTDPFSIALSPSASFPSCKDVRLTLGAEISVLDFLSFHGSYTFDLDESRRDEARPVPFSFGLSFIFKSEKIEREEAEKRGDQEGIRVNAGAAPLQGNVWAIGAGASVPFGSIDRNPPIVAVDQEDTVHLSPNFDGEKDELILPISITDERYVFGYRLVIQDSGGAAVRTVVNKEARPENEGFRSVIDRLTAVKEGIPIPESLRWDGKSDSGTVVADGTYTYHLEAWDDNENLGRTDVRQAVVDTTPPSVEITVPHTAFSPNGDGNQDVLIVEQRGSSEVLWSGTFTDAGGRVIRELSWDDTSPPAFQWTGQDEEGILPSDGVYSYVVSSTDLAGNTGSARFDNIILAAAATPVSLTVSVGAFSPNGDGVQDGVRYGFEVPVRSGVKSWALEVKDRAGSVVRDFQGGSELPRWVDFDGKGRDGKVLKEGLYLGDLGVLYENGNWPRSESPEVLLDVTAPVGYVRAEGEVFSPNGDGRKDELVLFQESEEEQEWEGLVKDGAGRVVKRVSWLGSADRRYVWDGRGEDGKLAADGSYVYVLRGRDAAGNTGESEGARIEVDTRETPVQLVASPGYFSPNADGVQDTVRVEPELGVRDGVESWRYEVKDRRGQVVKSAEGRRQSPSEFEWDGLDAGGRRVSDGEYVVELEVVYLSGNRHLARTGVVALDTEFPRVDISSDVTIFSPDGDGRQDTVRIVQGGSEEELWEGRIANAGGQEMRKEFWKGGLADFVWDGKDGAGNRVTDGEYRYTLSSRDRAGNLTEVSLGTLEIDTVPRPVSLTVSVGAFSPDGDGVQDVVRYGFEVPVRSGVKSWELGIADSAGQVVRSFKGGGELPQWVDFDGKSEAGSVLSEGLYLGELGVLYENGNWPRSESPEVRLDVTAPLGHVRAEGEVFSPNGDGRKDELVLFQESEEEREWEGLVKDGAGRVVKRMRWLGRADRRYVWDGRGEDGKLVTDGEYEYILVGYDAAGNVGESEGVKISVDTRETPMQLVASPGYFSPNADGIQDTVRVEPELGVKDGVESWRYDVKDRRGQVVRSAEGRLLPAVYVWDGLDAGGRRASDGEYVVELEVVYRSGNRPLARTGAVVLDTVFPQAQISSDVTIFSPDGDGRQDTVRIVQGGSEEELWEGRIVNAGGQEMKKEFWKGGLQDFVWDGKDGAGNRVTDGAYRYTLSSRDRAGNATTVSLGPLKLDTRATPVYLTVSERGFSPNGDGVKDTVKLTPFLTVKEGVDSWSLTIEHEKVGVRKTFSGSGFPPAEIVWDGKGERAVAEDGFYKGTLTVSYIKGNRPKVSSLPFRLDTEAPELEVTLGPLPFSPDNDGVDDELNIDLAVDDLSSITSWELRILDPKGKYFTSYKGRGTPSPRIIWDGISDSGELVQSAEDYTLIFSVQDDLGNSTTRSSVIPVDVLVIREGNRLKIIISSIIFAPDTADFENVEEVVKNLKTVERLAEIFKKYSDYRILIEGHAVMVYWDDPARGRKEQTEELIPLSKARAESVKLALVRLGVEANRITTEGIGGAKPIVPFSDLENRWKNRRVEFILVK